MRDMISEKLASLAARYGFKFHYPTHEHNYFALYSKNIDGEYELWIFHYEDKDYIEVAGNTDQLNIWLSETRSDLTMEQVCDFVAELSKIGNRRLVYNWAEMHSEEDWKQKLPFSLVVDWEDIQEMPHSDPAFDLFDGTNIDECVRAYIESKK
ncbi:MAG: hypothetical protein IJJ43_06265 [Oscillospiraceae bacterium]|nr:hypothetical protein [Oscillospiraceae bacterium]MBQ6465852.1 hypothetical protein [Oscillospiraceae bacterium]